MNAETLQTEPDGSDSQETEAELAPATGEDQQTTTGDESQTEATQEKDPAGYTKAINKKHHQLMEERRQREAAEAETERLRALIPQQQRPVVPPLPDPYDADFAQQSAERDKAVLESAQFDAKQAAEQDRATAEQSAETARQQTAAAEQQRLFGQRAATQGISETELAASVETVAAYGGIGADLAQHIMGDENGPSVVAYLAQNPEEVLAIQGMSALQGAVYVANTVKAKAAALHGNKGSQTPAPADTLGGGGAPPTDEGPKGATYE